MPAARDVLVGCWVTVVAAVAFVCVPAIALGRARGREAWWPECFGGCCWTLLTAIVVVPALATFHLFNWATAALIPFVWPAALWVRRHRGAPGAEFRNACRTLTLAVFDDDAIAAAADAGATLRLAVPMVAAAGAVIFWTALREARLTSAADYTALWHTQQLMAGGQLVTDPIAALAALLSRLSALEPAEVMRFMRPLALFGMVLGVARLVSEVGEGQSPAVAASVGIAVVLPGGAEFPSACAALTVAIGVALVGGVAAAVTSMHRRDRWHVLAAGSLCAIAVASMNPSARASATIEYDSAARQVLSIARTFKAGEWAIVAPPIHRVQVANPSAVIPLADFLRRYGARAASPDFRVDLPVRNLFVFVEKMPLAPTPAASADLPFADTAAAYRLQNARAKLERDALQWSEAYRRSHVGVTIAFEDATLRVYRLRLR